MHEGTLCIADFTVFIRAKHPYVFEQCARYRAKSDAVADLAVEVSPDELAAELALSSDGMDEGYIESICLYRAICRRLPPLGGLFFHAAVLEDRTDVSAPHGYAFTADSGTGKSTHVRLWQRAFGERIRIINGDKPILRRHAGQWYAYGTPWCGKEGWNIPASVPLDAVCFLHRGESNTIRPLPADAAVSALFPQLLLPDDSVSLTATLELLDDLVHNVPFYELHCTASANAAHVARTGMQASRQFDGM